MAEQDEIAFLYPSGGMNGAGCSNRVPSNQYRRATNVTLEDELPTTRPRVRIYDFEPAIADSLEAEFFKANNVQGCRFFNPAKGQGGLILAAANAQIMVANGGRKFTVGIEGTGASTRALVTDISGNFVTSKMLHLVWWVTAENYAIAGDGSSNTFIYDAASRTSVLTYSGRGRTALKGTLTGLNSNATGEVVTDSLEPGKEGEGTLSLSKVAGEFIAGEVLQSAGSNAVTILTAFNNRGGSVSAGYNSVDKGKSKLPNGATVMVYAHGRICIVVNSRQILVGDSIFKTDLTSADNLLDATEQVYWDTGTYFLPPSAMGGISAAEILPLRNTQHGHGEIMFHCEDGVFSLDINQSPRSEWKNRQLVKTALLQAGAVGPYAVSLRDGDQIYRSRHGITTIRSAAAEDNVEGNPQTPLSEPIRTLLKADTPEWLRFCSLVVWEAQRRMLCTIDPCMDGRFRWHRGLVVRNFNPMPSERSVAAWEGLWTLPKEACGIVQFVNGLFVSSERMFAFCRGEDGVNRLVEFTNELGDDILPDGTRRRIRCQAITRAVDLNRPFLKKDFVSGSIFFRKVSGIVDWGVWARAIGETSFTLWRNGTFEVAEFADELQLETTKPLTKTIALGKFPRDCTTAQGSARSIEFLIRWKGVAQVEGLRLMIAAGDQEAEKIDVADFSVSSDAPLASDYDDFEYSTDNDWTSKL